jgi:pyruvate/2-oxoacid:ferredoxin oxidoreductase alpha subunit
MRELIDGSTAIVRGALAAGCDFFAGYPITPASPILMQMMRELPKVGGTAIQGEDEIASIGMCVGAVLAGARAMTATSGPGISLYSETIGLAVMGEVPLVIVDVQRLGPATGGATTVGQGDAQFVRWGTAGGFPVIVLAPASVPGCYRLTQEAFALAERFRCPVFLLTDKELGLTLTTVETDAWEDLPVPQRRLAAQAPEAEGASPLDRRRRRQSAAPPESMPSQRLPDPCSDHEGDQPASRSDATLRRSEDETGKPPPQQATTPSSDDPPYRYEPADEVPPMRHFGGDGEGGEGGGTLRFTGSTHDERAFLTKDPATVGALNRHLIAKVEEHRDEIERVAADLEPGARTLLVSWGITAGAQREAVARLRGRGGKVSAVTVESLWPVPETALGRALDGIERVVVAELNPGLYRREIERLAGGREVAGLNRLDGELISPEDIVAAVS